jgi:AcrR family transcriptional regulator
MEKTPRQQRRFALKQELILQAAARVFAQKGYRHATIRDVADAADVADGTIYNYFKNKEDLLAALVDQLSELEQRPLFSETEPLEQVVLERMRQLHANYEGVSAVLPEIIGTPELRQRYLQEFINPVAQSLEKDLIKQGAPAQDTALRARILLSSVLGFQVLLALGDPITSQAWEKPQALAQVWSQFIAMGAKSDPDHTV